MHIEELLTDDAVLAEIGRRLEHHRLQRNWTQAQLAFEAQIGKATLQRMERGRSAQTLSLIKVLRALELLAPLDAAIPESLDLPIAELARARRGPRQRARARVRGRGEQPSTREAWRWGEEPEADA